MSEAAAPAPSRPAKPRVSVPPRPSVFSEVGASPGPLTLASNLFAGEHASFTQLLVGLSSPTPAWPSPGAPPSLFMVSPGFSPGMLLSSPALFSPTPMGQFGMSHQEVLAQVHAQANQSHLTVLSPPEQSVSMTTATTLQHTASMASVTQQHMGSPEQGTAWQTEEGSQRQDTAAPVDKPADDGYNWRKYGQKTVKGSECPRSYYKCTFPNCPVKKKVEHSPDGQISEITYKSKHNHQPPQKKRSKDCAALPVEHKEFDGAIEIAAQANATTSAPLIIKEEHETAYGTSDRLSGSSDGKEIVKNELRPDEPDDGEADSKRRNIQLSSQRSQSEQRIVVQTTSEVDLLDDGYRWRKYGQKVVKGNPHPRSYYKCTYVGCTVRKHIERASTDAKAVITTYEGKHNHELPTRRGGGQNSGNPVALNSTQHK